jgi:hypothetical protein
MNSGAISQGRARGNDAIAAVPDAEFLRHTGRRPNVVFGFHVLEHMTDPVHYLRELATCLAADSIVILFVPNALALFPAAYGFARYPWFSFPEHLNLFSPHSVSCLARHAGYALLEVSSACAGGLEPEMTGRLLAGRIKTPVMDAIRSHLIEAGLMGEELVFVLSPVGSPTAPRHSAEFDLASSRCATNAAFESAVRRCGEASGFVNSLALQVDPLEMRDLAECRQILAERNADLARALERIAQSERDRLQIETSTFWRATAVPRRLVNWLKSRLWSSRRR